MSGEFRFGNQATERVRKQRQDSTVKFKRCPDCRRILSWLEPSDTMTIECTCGKTVHVKPRIKAKSVQ